MTTKLMRIVYRDGTVQVRALTRHGLKFNNKRPIEIHVEGEVERDMVMSWCYSLCQLTGELFIDEVCVFSNKSDVSPKCIKYRDHEFESRYPLQISAQTKTCQHRL